MPGGHTLEQQLLAVFPHTDVERIISRRSRLEAEQRSVRMAVKLGEKVGRVGAQREAGQPSTGSANAGNVSGGAVPPEAGCAARLIKRRNFDDKGLPK